MATGIFTLCKIRYVCIPARNIFMGVHEIKINSIVRFQREVVKFSGYMRITNFTFLKYKYGRDFTNMFLIKNSNCSVGIKIKDFFFVNGFF